MGVTELGRMMGNDPNLALSVPHRLGRWEVGRSGGGMDPQRKGWMRVQVRPEETSISNSLNSSGSTSGERTPPQGPQLQASPPRPPRRNSATSRVARKSPPPEAQTKPKGKGKGKGTPPRPPKSPAPPLENGGRDPYGNVPGVGDMWYVPWKEGGKGGTVSQVTVMGDGDEELDPGEWWVVSQGSNGEEGKKGKKRKREKGGGTFRVPMGYSSSPGRMRRHTSGRPCGRGATGTTGMTGMTGMTRGTRMATRGRVVTRGVRWVVTRGVRRKGTRGLRRGLPGAGMCPGNPPPRKRGKLRIATREWGPGGAGGLIGLPGLIGLTHHQVAGPGPRSDVPSDLWAGLGG